MVEDPTGRDRRPGIVICAYDAEDPVWDFVEDLSGRLWDPPGARTVAVPADEPNALAHALTERLREGGCQAMLLVGRSTRAPGFRVQMRAEGRTPGEGKRLSGTGPSIARSTAPVADMVRALQEAGLKADASSEAEDDVGSYLLYRLLSELPDSPDAPAIGLLRTPGPADEAAISKGVKAAASAMARRLTPLSRPA
ncbi:hypothetical protein [Brevundimonas sp. UBA7534]|uniref:hypothetical protein n=1 Tax=Brevundimonas sp. UBA7534 TaxID=1946138 RepID=UPI0025C59E51|nr:hypothetical protein [Brevundimonas sp. UBA7534]